MTEENNNPVPPQPPAAPQAQPPAPPAPLPPAAPQQAQPPAAPPPPPTEAELKAQCEAAKSSNRVLKIILIVLSLLLLAAGVAGFIVYRKIMSAKDAVEEAFQAFPQQAMFQQIQAAAEASARKPGVYYSTSMPSSSLGLFSGGIPGAPGPEAQQQAQQLMTAMNKYADRPIVKEFLADLKKNPDMAKAFAEGQGGNPIAMIAGIQNARGMEAIMAKYVSRPEFMQLLTDISRDPDLAAAGRGLAPGMLPSIPGMQPPPAGDHATAVPGDPDEPQVGEGMTLDPSAISGQPAPAPSKTVKKVPAPVDSD